VSGGLVAWKTVPAVSADRILPKCAE